MLVADMWPHAKVLYTGVEVAIDFLLGRKGACPAGVRREGERIEVRLHVAGARRIGIVAPCAAHRVGAFQHNKVFIATLLEPESHAQAGKARADNRDLRLGCLCHTNLTPLCWNFVQRSLLRSRSAPLSPACSVWAAEEMANVPLWVMLPPKRHERPAPRQGAECRSRRRADQAPHA